MNSTEPTLPVNEIFYSLQGEGFHTGTPAVFVRLSGCNLACDFCDTDHLTHRSMSVADIAARVAAYPVGAIVVITGGEPSLHPLEPLIDSLHAAGRRVHIETNGTRPLPASLDWVTCSPKQSPVPLAIDHCDELKVVFTGQDVEAVAAAITARHHFLQPCSGMNTAEVVDYILAHPRWRLSLQTHKIINVR